MARNDKHYLQRLSDRTGQEIERDSDRLSNRIADELLDDRVELSTPELLTLFRERYATDPTFAAKLVERMGPEAFNRAYAAAYGIPVKEMTLARVIAGQNGVPEALPDGLSEVIEAGRQAMAASAPVAVPAPAPVAPVPVVPEMAAPAVVGPPMV